MTATTSRPRRRISLVWPMTVALVVTAVAPVLAVGAFQRAAQQDALTERAVDDLHVVADVQQARLASVVSSTRDHVRLVTSRTQMRSDFAAVAAGATDRKVELDANIRDAAAASNTVAAIALIDRDGGVIATTDPTLADAAAALVVQLDAAAASTTVSIVESGDQPRWLLAAPVQHLGIPVGAAVVAVDAGTLLPLSSTAHEHEHGITTCVFARTSGGAIVSVGAMDPTHAARCDALRDPRTAQDAAAGAIDTPLASLSLDGSARDFVDVSVGGAAMVAATRTIDTTGWGLIVTLDRDDFLAPIQDTARQLALATSLLAAIAVIAAIGVSHWLTAPIRSLRDAAASFRRDGIDVPADIDAPGELGELAETFNELTGRVRAEQHEAERRYEDLELLTRAMAHDLKGPLTNVRGLVETVVSGRVTDHDQQHHLLMRALTASVHMQDQIDNLLALIRSVGKPHDFTAVDLSAVAADVVDQLGNDAHVTVDPLPAVSGDQILLERLLLNLVENAEKYHAEGATPQIHVHAEPTSDGHATVIHVDDGGIGIPPDQRHAVLHAFRRGANPSKAAGAGLGLSIVASVVAHHDGQLAISDSPLGGTRVSVTLPYGPPSEAP
ncbi:MAG: HAMP domain-containing sensor histidine kinase [Nitriliruptoraceae bacterium]